MSRPGGRRRTRRRGWIRAGPDSDIAPNSFPSLTRWHPPAAPRRRHLGPHAERRRATMHQPAPRGSPPQCQEVAPAMLHKLTTSTPRIIPREHISGDRVAEPRPWCMLSDYVFSSIKALHCTCLTLSMLEWLNEWRRAAPKPTRRSGRGWSRSISSGIAHTLVTFSLQSDRATTTARRSRGPFKRRSSPSPRERRVPDARSLTSTSST